MNFFGPTNFSIEMELFFDQIELFPLHKEHCGTTLKRFPISETRKIPAGAGYQFCFTLLTQLQEKSSLVPNAGLFFSSSVCLFDFNFELKL